MFIHRCAPLTSSENALKNVIRSKIIETTYQKKACFLRIPGLKRYTICETTIVIATPESKYIVCFNKTENELFAPFLKITMLEELYTAIREMPISKKNMVHIVLLPIRRLRKDVIPSAAKRSFISDTVSPIRDFVLLV